MTRGMRIGTFVTVIIMAAGVGIWLSQKSPQESNAPPEKVSVAIAPPSFTTYTIIIAFEKGYFKDEGLDVRLQTSYPHGKATLNAVIDRKADFGASSETPFMHAVLGGGQLYVIATTVTAENDMAVVGRTDRGIFAPQDLKGKTIGVTIGSNGEYFIETVLLLHGIPRDEVSTVNLKPNQMYDALMNGDVDAIATWNPQMYRAQKKLGDRGVTFSAEGLYVPSFIIAARQDYVHSNPKTVAKVVRALNNASNLIQNNPNETQLIVSRYLKIDTALLKELSAIYRFKVSRDQSFLLTLENQSKWAIKHKLTDQTNVPNYLDFIYLDAVAAVKPENVTIIR